GLTAVPDVNLMQTGVRAVTIAPSPVLRARAIRLVLLAAGATLILAAGCRHDSAHPIEKVDPSSSGHTPWLPPSGSGFVGSEACGACHRSISESYSAHPMARSLRAVDINRERSLV